MVYRQAASDPTIIDAEKNDVTEFAEVLYGADWNRQFAKDLSLEPTELTAILASSDPLGADFVQKVGSMMDVYLSELEAKLQETLTFTALLEETIRAGPSAKPLGRVEWLDQLAMVSVPATEKRRKKYAQVV